MAEPTIVLYDIETTHNLVAAFNLLNHDMLPIDNIVQERYIVCAAWKTLGAKTVQSVTTADNPKRFGKNPHDDRHVCEVLHEVLSNADVIAAHNGDQYDIKFAEARMLYHGLSPLPPITKIDTYKTAKDRFLFNSNKLDYLGQFLGLGRKKPTSPKLWLRVLQGDKAAIREMESYNKQDVELLEQIFLKLRPYMGNHVNRQLLGGMGCPRCGSSKIQSRGIHKAISRVYQRYQCQSCGGWFREVKGQRPSATYRVL